MNETHPDEVLLVDLHGEFGSNAKIVETAL